MGKALAWLPELKAVQLHRIAILAGSPCSGTKATVVQGIQNAMAEFQRHGQNIDGRRSRLSLLSIDMGIRNLAFAHLTAPTFTEPRTSPKDMDRGVVLEAWKRINVASGLNTAADFDNTVASSSPSGISDKLEPLSQQLKETFEPIDYARHAYRLVRSLIDTYRPTHVIIERQRFRSGGGPAVQEWTIRVGVFEGMLYAVFRSLVEERTGCKHITVEPVLPSRVNRYWLEGVAVISGDGKEKLAGREVKQAKINLVKRMLHSVYHTRIDARFRIGSGALSSAESFLPSSTDHEPSSINPTTVEKKGAREKRSSTTNTSKSDDLADCLLQGLAWLDWQETRGRLAAAGPNGLPGLS